MALAPRVLYPWVMCTIVILRRPGHAWPVLIAANRDEMADRAWHPPGRHWPEHPAVVAGRDDLAGGTWLGLNDHGVVAAVLNRINTLGPAPGFRSRGELPLMALDHADARSAVAALGRLHPADYRPFNMIVVDRDDGYWLRVDHDRSGSGSDDAGTIAVDRLPAGLSMITAYDLNDLRSPRIRCYLPQFEAAPVPDPGSGDWKSWRQLLGERAGEADAGPGGAMTVATLTGFGTVCSTLIALPGAAGAERTTCWLFAPGPPDRVPFTPIAP